MLRVFEDFDKYKSITYPVREPFQFVNLFEQDGDIIYHAIEPQFTPREKIVMRKVSTAYDMLVNVGTVLIDVEDKLRFLEDTYREILSIYSIRALRQTSIKESSTTSSGTMWGTEKPTC